MWEQIYGRSYSLLESCSNQVATLYVKASLQTQLLFACEHLYARSYSLRESCSKHAATLFVKASLRTKKLFKWKLVYVFS